MAHVRDATENDLPAIFAIYHEQVRSGTATFDTVEKSLSEQADWFRAHPRDRYPVIVAEEHGTVLGWARLYPWSPRRAYDRTAENSVYVDPAARGRGIGRLLMQELVSRARHNGICVLIARVTEGNPASLALHEAMGFRSIGIMRRVGVKFGRILDVRILQAHLDEPDEPPGTGGSPPDA